MSAAIRMSQPFRIRLFAPTDADYAAISAIGASTPPAYALDYEFRNADDWRALDDSFAQAARPLVRYVAEADGQTVAYAYSFEIAWAPPAGRYYRVRSAARLPRDSHRRRVEQPGHAGDQRQAWLRPGAGAGSVRQTAD